MLENDAEYTVRTCQTGSELNGNCALLWNGPNFPESMTVETCWATVKMFNRAACVPKRTLKQLWLHTGEAMYTDKVAAPATHNYKGGNFVADANGESAAALAYLKHTWESPEGGCTMHIAQNGDLRAAGFTDMKDGVCPEHLKELRDAPNRAVLRFKVAEYLAQAEDELGEQMEGGDEDEDGEDEE